MNPAPRFSFVVSSSNDGATLRTALDSILSQQGTVECFVVDAGSKDDSPEIVREYGDRLACFEIVRKEEEVEAINRAFARSRGELLWWLTGGEKLVPWACRLTSFVFDKLEPVHWLTSGTPVTWTASQMCVPSGLADGYVKSMFFQGRNLKTSPYFRQPIWRAGTVWRRGMWVLAGNFIAAPLDQAGDFELWTRFWQGVAPLHTLNIPLAGDQSAARVADQDAYWRAASAHLDLCARLPAPSRLRVKIESQLNRRSPKTMRPYMKMAQHIRIAPSTLDCAIVQVPLV